MKNPNDPKFPSASIGMAVEDFLNRTSGPDRARQISWMELYTRA